MAAALLWGGCITHEETVYKDSERSPVHFENDTAARYFYEKLSRSPAKRSGTESRTEVKVPFVFKDERKVVAGSNTAFNKAVVKCDTDRDGTITEQEARIFASN
jgi:hypothetical protein